MRSPSGSLVLVAVALVALAAWLASGPGPARPSDDGGTGRAEPGDAPGGAGAVAVVRELDMAVEVAVRGELLPSAGTGPACRLVLGDRVVARAGRILAGVRAAEPGSREPGRHLIAFPLDDGRAVCRVVHLTAADVELDWTTPRSLRGVVRAADGEPVVGAEVWAGGIGVDGALETVTTGADGGFAFAAVEGVVGVPLTVWAAGFASRFDVVDPDRLGADPLELRLEPAAGLHVVLAASLADATPGRVALAPADDDVALRHYPFFLTSLRGGGALGPDGSATVADLPRDATVVVHVLHPELVGPAHAEARLRGPRSRVVVAGTTGPLVSGFVRDPDGAPLADVRVSAWAGGGARSRFPGALLDPDLHSGALARAATGPDGSFRIAVPQGEAVLELARAGHLGVRVPGATAGARPDVVLPRTAAVGEPYVVALHLRPEGRALRVRRDRGTSLRWTDREPFELRFDHASLVDLTIRLDDGGEPFVETVTGLAVIGRTELRIDR